jgi:hypothetical protein
MKREYGAWVVVGIRERSVLWVEKGNCANKSRYSH